MEILMSVCFVLTGFFFGIVIGRGAKNIDGLFIVDDYGDINEPIHWVLDMKIDPEEIPNKKQVILKVCKADKGSCE